LFITTTNE